MAEIALSFSPGRAMERPRLDLLPLLCPLALGLGLACCLFSGFGTPLWFDETFSAVIASQDSLRGVVRWMLTELSGPTYYSFLFLWEKIAGNSNIALRLPSLIFVVSTPLLILWRGHPDHRVRMLWAAITALSVILFDCASQARPYALLILLANAQAIVFLRLIDAPRMRVAFLWTGISALLVLTHYYAAVICGLQGIAYLALCRGRALRTWPALLPLVPMALWMNWHLPFIFSYTQDGVAWYSKLGPEALWLIPSLLVGLAWPGAVLVATMLLSFGHDIVAWLLGRSRWPYSEGETALFLCGVLAAALVLIVGALVPSFTTRYLIPFAPALLAGVAIWTCRRGRLAPLVSASLLGVMICTASVQLVGYIREPQDDFRYAFNFEQPSEWIAAHGAKQVVMLWDNPTASLPDPDGHLPAVGNFFFQRSGLPIKVVSPRWPRHGDPNRLLLEMAGDSRDTAILWAYDVTMPGTRGREHPWAIPRMDPSWQCRDFGRAPITTLACVRGPA